MSIDLFSCDRCRESHCHQKELLHDYCSRHGLLLGQYAQWHDMSYWDYFEKYGVNEWAWRWAIMYDDAFREEAKDCLDEKAVDIALARWGYYEWESFSKARDNCCDQDMRCLASMRLYAQTHHLEVRSCLRNVHVYERIQVSYPHFNWRRIGRGVMLENYPVIRGRYPSLYELLLVMDKGRMDESESARAAQCELVSLYL